MQAPRCLTRRVSISSARLPSPKPKAAELGETSTKESGSEVSTRTSRRCMNHSISRHLRHGEAGSKEA